MASQDGTSLGLVRVVRRLPGRWLRGTLLLAMGCLAILSPFFLGTLAFLLVGLLLIACGVLEMLETFQAHDEARRRSTYLSGVVSVLAGILLLAQPQLLLRGLALLIACFFLIDGVGKAIAAFRTHTSRNWLLITGLINVLLALVLIARWPISGQAVVVILVGLRLLTTGWSLLLNQDKSPLVSAPPSLAMHPDSRLDIPPHPEFAKLQAAFNRAEEGRHPIDTAWCWTFVVVFFAIHIGRMHVEWNLVGMISPLVAVAGDVGTALLIAFGMVLPYRLAWRKLTRRAERQGWRRLLARIDAGRGPGIAGRLYRRWLVGRFHFSWRIGKMLYSPRDALRWGLQVGLPMTAILIAVNPIWGFSWFFNSESWATGVWDRWAAQRADTWREKMVRAVESHYQNLGTSGGSLFQVMPDGVNDKADFSFLVLGDTGEGGAAQHSLRDRFLFLGQRPDLKFLLISSDVIYPSGAMSDYEAKFYLPFKGFTKPIFAIPGNHDWYDALEAFAANFFESEAARACMLARITTDKRLTSTTEERIDAMIRKSAFLRQQYGVSTGWQRGPFFEIQTDRFALIAVDTGVLRRIDTDQWAWLQAALDRGQGKLIMAILGHPLYAGGRYQGGVDEPVAGEWLPEDAPLDVAGHRLGGQTTPFAAIHRLLREHQVQIVMAGDTHYFECYRESYESADLKRTMHHFVNGGGGAYMSIGTPLDWPAQPALADCAYYPRKDFLIDKLDRETPAWKTPIWLWVKHLGAWPVTAESVAGAFLYNQAPYLQSFVEVRVEKSRDRVRLIPHGTAGPVHWRELQTTGAMLPIGATAEDQVEFVFPLPKQRP
jgi:uncharacterized membrane protein HdeD (DUF308 family)